MPTLQREVSWRWRPPSISLMDWKRFTRKSSKPGGRGFENDDARGGHTHTHALAGWKWVVPLWRNKPDELFMCVATPPALCCMTTTRLSKWVRMQSHGADGSLTCEAQSWKRRRDLFFLSGRRGGIFYSKTQKSHREGKKRCEREKSICT